jgi:O-antigen ligase
MNGKIRSRLKSAGRQFQMQHEITTPYQASLSGDQLEVFSKPEGIKLPGSVQIQAADFTRETAYLMFMLTIATIPWRLRITILKRPQPPIYGDYTDFLLFIPDILMLLTLLFWMFSLILRPRRIRLGPAFISLPLAGITLMGGLSVFSSVDPALSAYHTLRLLSLFGFYLFILNEIRSLQDLALPAGLLIFSQGLVGVAQVLSRHSLNLQSLGEYQLDPSWNGVSIVWANGVRLLRAYGLSDHPNILGGCLACALLILGVKYASIKSGSMRSVYVALFGLGALTLLLTFSRSAWVALIAGSVLGIGLLYKVGYAQEAKQWFFLSLSSLILLSPFLLYLAPYLGVRLGIGGSFSQVPSEVQSIGERQLLDQSANRLFAQHPITGVGLGAFPLALQQVFPNFPVDYQPAHLVLLDVAVETGLFGALFYLMLLSAPWLALLLRRKQLNFSVSLIGASALLLAISLTSLFDYYTWLLVPGRLLAWLAWGLWASIYYAELRSEGTYA